MGELIDKAKGKAKRVQGKATGNRAKEAEGAAQELKGKAEGVFDDLKTDVKRVLRRDDDPRVPPDETVAPSERP
jgi:uncharacterized protein YjbJ (UPF0337 family)